jgi:hypothetical protein
LRKIGSVIAVFLSVLAIIKSFVEFAGIIRNYFVVKIFRTLFIVPPDDRSSALQHLQLT